MIDQQHWMQRLANHWQTMRENIDEQKLLIAFDIDGTLVDSRYTILYLLKHYDNAHNTNWFSHIGVNDISFYEGRIVDQNHIWDAIPEAVMLQILQFYREQRWQAETLLHSEKTYPQIIEVMEAIDACPNTDLALITGRCDSLRQATLDSLNNLVKNSSIEFECERLKMNPFGWEHVQDAKLKGLNELKQQGYKIIAMLDNEPSNLLAMAHLADEMLLMHADTHFGSEYQLPQGCVAGDHYCIKQFSAALKAA